MARTTENEREALRQAATAAAPILAKLRQERTELDRRIARLELVVSAYDEAIGRRRRRISDSDAGAVMPKMRRGQATAHIDGVLSGGGDYTEPELRKAIFNAVGISYNRPTLYSALRRGARAGRYEAKENRWRMKN